jgi:hypothetical protein
MNVAVTQDRYVPAVASAHPNEFDRRRIERALANRKRYRYVSPSVHAVESGYLIKSPCCSRNIDPDGGIVDIALLRYAPGPLPWRLYRKEHSTLQWHLQVTSERLVELLDQLNADPERKFWQ